jgi:vitamin B12 transporter
VFGYFGKAAICACLFTATLCTAAPVFAQSEEEMDILQMIYKDKDLVTPTRSPKPISQVAENITVIDAEEIEAINAHTLADVLFHVTGVQTDIQGGPGSTTNVLIQGSDPRHVRVMVDGVSLNNITSNIADIGSFPVQQIERIEIIKGPASSAWGSSLGGIINIITKSPDPERKFGGTASAAIGERTTADIRADLSGTVGNFGYYINGGGLTSDGLTPNTQTDRGDFYTKLEWKATPQARLQLSVSYNKGSRGDGGAADPFLGEFTFRDNFEYFFAAPSFSYTFNDALNLEVSGRVSTKRNRQAIRLSSSGEDIQSIVSNELDAGGSAKLNWRSGIQSLSVGADYDSGAVDSGAILDGRQSQVRWALFANDTISLWKLSFTPGIRYDHTSTNGDFVSPSFGITYTPFEKTIIRAYVARGFNTPPLGNTFGDGFFAIANPGLKPEKVWSYSLGGETAVSKYLWLKVTGFLHDISDVLTSELLPGGTTTSTVNSGKQRRQGVEAEIRTLPVWNTSILAGYSFIDITNRTTGEVVKNFPRQTWDLGVDYNDNEAWRGALRGHWIWWNADADSNGKYSAMIWDLHLARKVIEKGSVSVEAFFSVHNIFSGSQYSSGFFPNPGRWFEGGLRCKF